MTTDEIKRNIDDVTERIRRAEARAGVSVSLVAATKCVPPETIDVALGFGITDIGENRVNEYRQKVHAVGPARWHFIGKLQRNKVKYIAGNVELIQSVDSFELACDIDGFAAKRGKVQDVLIEVNVAGESGKTGVSPSVADELIARVQELKNIRVRGLMSVPPVCAEDRVYKTLYALYEKRRSATFDILSVGMSDDYEKAISFGADMVRIGRAIFGERQ